MIRNNEDKREIKTELTKNKRPKLEIKEWGVSLLLPEGYDISEAYRIIERHKAWIQGKHLELLRALEKSKHIKLAERSREELKILVTKTIEQATREILGINPLKVTIRRMRTRWGSLSPKGTITINELAKYLPDKLVSYIIFHEICHVIEPRHSNAFWECVKRHFPNHEELEQELLLYEVRLGLHDSTGTF